MEAKEWATRILSADTIEEKLLNPGKITDHSPGSAIFWDTPTRPQGMEFQKKSKKDKLPPLHELSSPDKRAICLHRFAGHELLAVEIMAYALLAFPEAPLDFRKGLIKTLKEEQGHVRMYMRRLEEFGVKLGDMPLYKHFWAAVPYLKDPVQYVSTMSLTFEMANLDFAPMYGKAFEQVEDLKSQALMKQIFNDELKHVNFGWQWLNHLHNCEDSWEAYCKALPPYLSPKRASGHTFSTQSRLDAGVSPDWIKNLCKNS